MKILPFDENDFRLVPAIQPEGWNDIRPFLHYYLDNPKLCFPIKTVEGTKLIGTGSPCLPVALRVKLDSKSAGF